MQTRSRTISLLAAAALLVFAAGPSPAAPKKQGSQSQQQPTAGFPPVNDPHWGYLGAAGGNNANSMSGDNSATNNANGRTGGGYGGN